MNKNEIIKAIKNGIQNANSTYEQWTHEEMWLNDSGVENLLTVKIAEEIVDCRNALHLDKEEFLRLETTFKDIKNNSKAHKGSGNRKAILKKHQQRVDITLWNKHKQITGLVEVKRKWDESTCRHDLDKIKALIQDYGINEGGSIEFGILAIFIAQRDEERVKSKFNAIKDYCEKYDHAGLNPLRTIKLQTKKYPEDDWTSGGALIVIDPE